MSEATTEFKLTYYESPRAGRLALLTMDNGEDHRRPNTFSREALASLEGALDELETQEDVKGLMLVGKPHVFAAGADMNSFWGADEAFARGASQAGHGAFSRLAALPYPTLAAINGACVGGGLEIALHCDYRSLSSAAAAIASSEVFLSIIPAWGGTQLLPPLVGAPGALRVIVHNALANNRMMKPPEAVELGLADRLIPAVDFFDDSVALLEGLVTGEETIERAEPSDVGLDDALADARRAADDRTHGATPAPYVAIDLIEFAARGGDLAEGRAREVAALADLLPSRQAQASVYSFDITQRRVRKQPGKPDTPARPMTKVGVVGAGLMGAQLGALLLGRTEAPLVMKDIDEEVLEQARATIEGELDKRVERGRLNPARAGFLKSIVTYTLDYEPLAGADLVLEAVVEVADVKRKILAEVEQVVDAGTILATNTSALSVAAMAGGLAHPERVVGLHFFHPVAVLPLLEVVRAEGTNDTTLSTAFEVGKQLRKSAVLCADTPGFIVNRLLLRFTGACVAALRHGNDFAEIDDAVKALGMPMGPFELLGFSGVEVALRTAKALHDAYPDRFEVDENLRRIAELDVPGIYDWSQGRVPFDEVREAVHVEGGATPWTADEIREAGLQAVAEEARIMLDEGTVADARDIDTGMLLGVGWPFFNGGICMYLDQTGVSQRLFGERLVGLEDRGL